MKGYKAFEKGLICRGKQYAENTVFEESEAVICNSGMHFCKNPLDTLDYYPLIDANGNMTEFAEVEALDEVLTNDDKKYCTKKLKVGAKLSVADFVKIAFEVTKERITKEANLVGGYKAKLVGGNDAKLVGGNYAKLVGGYGANLVGGDCAKLVGGDEANLVGGNHSILVGDNQSVGKGKKGTLLVLVEREWVNGEYTIKSFKAEIIDGEKIKEDTFYRLVDGEFVEA